MMFEKDWRFPLLAVLTLIIATWWSLLLINIKHEIKSDERLFALISTYTVEDMRVHLRQAQALVELNYSLFAPKKTSLSKADIEKLFNIFHEEASKFSDVDYIAYGSEAKQYISVDFAKQRGNATGFLADKSLTNEYLWSFPFDDWKFHLNPQGQNSTEIEEAIRRISPENLKEKYDPTKRPWYEPTTKQPNREVFVINPFTYATQESTGINISKPVRNFNKIVGVHSVSLDQRSVTDRLRDSIKQVGMADSAKGYGYMWIKGDFPFVIAQTDIPSTDGKLNKIDQGTAGPAAELWGFSEG